MLEQRALARRSNTLNLVERRGLHLLLAPGAMGADGEAMGLVAELLDAIKHGVARLEQQRLAALHIDALAAGIAVRSLGNSGELDLAKPELVEHGHGRRQLPWPAVDQHEIGRGPAFGEILVPRKLAETPCQHFPHHGVIVPGGKVLRAHIELPILIAHEPFRPRHDHGADRIGAGNMAVVEHLDALGALLQIEQLGKPGKDRRLRGRLGEPPRQGLAGVDEGMRHELALLAALRGFDPDLVAGAQRQRVGKQSPPGDLMGEQHELRRRLVVIELGNEGFEHLFHREALVGTGKVGAVAPIVAGAEEEHLDRGLPRLLMGGEHVGLLHGLRVDALMRLDVAERGQPVAETRRALIVLLEARIVHQSVHAPLHLVALAGEEAERLVDEDRHSRLPRSRRCRARYSA